MHLMSFNVTSVDVSMLNAPPDVSKAVLSEEQLNDILNDIYSEANAVITEQKSQDATLDKEQGEEVEEVPPPSAGVLQLYDTLRASVAEGKKRAGSHMLSF